MPVHKDDFKKINEFAESAWICREPNQADTIRGTRRELLREVSEASTVGILSPFRNLFNLKFGLSKAYQYRAMNMKDFIGCFAAQQRSHQENPGRQESHEKEMNAKERGTCKIFCTL